MHKNWCSKHSELCESANAFGYCKFTACTKYISSTEPIKPLSQPSDKPLHPLERNELKKAMLGRGVNYETIQLILSDFDARIKHMRELLDMIDEW